MTIDIIMVNFRNYYLLDKQIEHWKNHIKGDYRLVIVDNTPAGERIARPDTIPFDPSSTFDGISSGEAYDFAIQQTSSDIIGFTDTDNFFLNPYILTEIEDLFKRGYQSVGAAGFYKDWNEIINKGFPEFHGDLAPGPWAQFMTRELALSETFVCEPPGVGKVTGWRIRKKIIDEKIPCVVWPGFFPFEDDDQICAFGPECCPKAVHMLKGCSSRAHLMPEAVPRALEWGMKRWECV